MNAHVLRSEAVIDVDNDDALNFRGTCAFSRTCLAQGCSKPALQELHCLVRHIGLVSRVRAYPRGAIRSRPSLPCTPARSKTYLTGSDGQEQVLASFCPAR